MNRPKQMKEMSLVNYDHKYWSANAFTHYSPHSDIGLEKLGDNSDKLLGLAYLRLKFKRIHDQGFSLMENYDGPHRSGKSLSAILNSWIVDPTFEANFENRIVQDHKQFADTMERAARDFKLKGSKGIAIVVDEAGTSMGSDDWYTKWMKSLTQMMQMFGYLCPMISFVSPVKDFVNSKIRKMFQYYNRMQRYGNTCTYLYPYECKYSSMSGKPYYKKIVARINYENIKIDRIKYMKPPADLVERYMALEQNRKQDMMEDFVEQLRIDERKEVVQKRDIPAIVRKVVENYNDYAQNVKKDRVILSKGMLMYQLSLKNQEAEVVKIQAEKKLFKMKREQNKETTDFDSKK